MGDFKAMLKDGIFVFLVGPEEQRFELHSAIVSQHSPILKSLIKNDMMEESLTKAGKLKDVDIDVFTLFAEYIYTGVYRLAPKLHDNFQSEISAVQLAEKLRGVGLGEYYCRKCSTQLPFVGRPFPFCNLECNSETNCCVVCRTSIKSDRTLAICDACIKRRNISVQGSGVDNALWKSFSTKQIGALGMTHDQLQCYLDENFIRSGNLSEDLLAHAKLHTFADCYQICALKFLCLHKLHRDLMCYRIQQDSVTAVTEVIVHAYENTVEADSEEADVGEGCGLRDLIVAFTAAHAEGLVKMKDFKALLKEGEFAVDFARAVIRRLE